MNGQARGTSVRADGAGPYRFGRRLKGLKWLGRYLGEVYRARHSETEQPELVLMRKRRGRFSGRLRLRIEPGYIGVRLAMPSVPDDLAAVRRDVLMAMTDATEALEVAGQRPGVLEDLLSPVHETRAVLVAEVPSPPSPDSIEEPLPAAQDAYPAPATQRRRWSRWSALASAVAATAGIALWLSPAPVGDQAEPVIYVPVQRPSDVAWADVLAGASTPAPYTVERRLVVPSKPLEGQARPPCKAPSREVNGGCWVALDDRPPCPPKTAESKGKCWIPLPEDPDKKVPLGIGDQPGWR